MNLFFDKIINIIYPPTCIACNILISQHGYLCSTCWLKLNFISNPKCHKCGMPFAYEFDEQATCAKCIETVPYYESARSSIIYDDFSSKLISSFKYYDQTILRHGLSNLVSNLHHEFNDKLDFICPIPLHRKRLFSRRYNQAALLASSLGEKINLPAYLDIIRRSKNVTAQTKLSRNKRLENLKNVFYINKPYLEFIKNKNILLVDDVMTTGTTVNECSKLLIKHNAKKIYVITIARTISRYDKF